MNRTYIAVALICAAAAAPVDAATILPGIGGNVLLDGSSDPISGVTLKLFRDDGDGVFDPAIDPMVGGSVQTDATGSYVFDNLAAETGYFVQRPTQEILGSLQPAQVSGLLSPSASLLTIDTFEDHQKVTADPLNPGASSAISDGSSSALGGERDLYVKLGEGVGEVSLRSNAFGVDVLQYDTASGVLGQGVITWDGVDYSGNPVPALGLGNVDLTVGGTATGFLVKLGIDISGDNELITFCLFRDSVDEFAEASAVIPLTNGTATETVFIPYADFDGPVSAEDVNAIQLLIGEGSKSVDAQVAYVTAIGPVEQNFAVVPEPSSVVLALLGFLSMLKFRRRR